MKECEKVKENLSAYIDEMLDETEKEQILLHLQSCTSCAEEYEFLKAISETAKGMPEL
ncbi:MAG: zf-HC2 domain-containing protein, partial [Clostridia bacterium]|nr:zf-HC2 domain-containing protein [Clostridia bacterium]